MEIECTVLSSSTSSDNMYLLMLNCNWWENEMTPVIFNCNVCVRVFSFSFSMRWINVRMKFNALKYMRHLRVSSQKVKCVCVCVRALFVCEWEKMRVFLSLSGFPIPPNCLIENFDEWNSVCCIPLIRLFKL